MKTLGAGLVIVTAAILTGCATTPPAQVWNNREGHYTENQAVAQLGPPRQAITLTDGSQVDTWFYRDGTRDSSEVYTPPTTHYVANPADFDLHRNTPYVPDEFLRLMFGPDGTLVAWDRPEK